MVTVLSLASSTHVLLLYREQTHYFIVLYSSESRQYAVLSLLGKLQNFPREADDSSKYTPLHSASAHGRANTYSVILYLLVSLGGVRPSLLSTSVTVWPIVPVSDDR